MRAGLRSRVRDRDGGARRCGRRRRHRRIPRRVRVRSIAYYELELSTGRYRVITAGAIAAAHVTNCNNDLPSGTHLVSLEDANEAAILHEALPLTPSRYYVGAFQALDSATPDVNWRVVTGGALPAGLWDGASPNDADTIEDGDENFVALYTNAAGATFLYDEPGGLVLAAVCECDGLAVVVTPPK